MPDARLQARRAREFVADPAMQRHLIPLPADRRPPFLFIVLPADRGALLNGVLITSIGRRFTGGAGLSDAEQRLVDAAKQAVVDDLRFGLLSEREVSGIWLDLFTGAITPATVPADPSWLSARLRDYFAFTLRGSGPSAVMQPHALPPPPPISNILHGLHDQPRSELERQRERKRLDQAKERRRLKKAALAAS